MIANLSQLLYPFLPFSSEKVQEKLELNKAAWSYVQTTITHISNVEPLFERIPSERIEEERKALIGRNDSLH